MTFLKPELNADGAANSAQPLQVTVTPGAHVPNAVDVGALVEAAHEHIEKLVSSELAGIQQTLTAAWRASEEALAQARAELDTLKKEHAALRVLHADSEKKVALLEEIRKKLAGL